MRENMAKSEIRRDKTIHGSTGNLDVKGGSNNVDLHSEGKSHVNRRKSVNNRLESKHVEGVSELHNPSLVKDNVLDEPRKNDTSTKKDLETKSAKTSKALENDQRNIKTKRLLTGKEPNSKNLYTTRKPMKSKPAQHQSAPINDPSLQRDAKDLSKPRSAGCNVFDDKIGLKDQQQPKEQDDERSEEHIGDDNLPKVTRSSCVVQENVAVSECTPDGCLKAQSSPPERWNNEKGEDCDNTSAPAEKVELGTLRKTLKSALKSTKTEKRVGDEPLFKGQSETNELVNSEGSTSYLYQYTLDLADLESEDSDEETCCFDDASEDNFNVTVENTSKTVPNTVEETSEKERSPSTETPQPIIEMDVAVPTAPLALARQPDYFFRWKHLLYAFTRARIYRLTLCVGWLVWAAWIMRLMGFSRWFDGLNFSNVLNTWGLLEFVGLVEVLGLLEVFWLLRRTQYGPQETSSIHNTVPLKAASLPVTTTKNVATVVPARSSSFTDSPSSNDSSSVAVPAATPRPNPPVVSKSPVNSTTEEDETTTETYISN